MDADAKFDPPVLRHPGIALDHGVLHLDSTAHGIHHAAELNDGSVTRALHHPALVHGYGGIDQVAAQRSQPRQRSILISAGKPTESDHIGSQDGRKFSLLWHVFLFFSPLRSQTITERDSICKNPKGEATGVTYGL